MITVDQFKKLLAERESDKAAEKAAEEKDLTITIDQWHQQVVLPALENLVKEMLNAGTTISREARLRYVGEYKQLDMLEIKNITRGSFLRFAQKIKESTGFTVDCFGSVEELEKVSEKDLFDYTAEIKLRCDD